MILHLLSCIKEETDHLARVIRIPHTVEIVAGVIDVGAGHHQQLVPVGPLLHEWQPTDFVELDGGVVLELEEDFVHAVVELLVLALEHVKADGLGLLPLVQWDFGGRAQVARRCAHRVGVRVVPDRHRQLPDYFLAGGGHRGGDSGGGDRLRMHDHLLQLGLVVAAQGLRRRRVEHVLRREQQHHFLLRREPALVEVILIQLGDSHVGVEG